MNAQEHYKQHLSQIYGWMIGDFDTARQLQQSFFQRNNITPGITGTALDLGCGHGLQSVSLANLGFKVHAVDFDLHLLRELNDKKESLSIITHQSTIIEFLARAQQQFDVVVCMGDTITHLETIDEVKKVFERAQELLVKGGQFILSFRDYSEARTGTDRFIPVRSEDSRIFTCFLEYQHDYVMVHDVVHEHTSHGWFNESALIQNYVLVIWRFQNGLNRKASE